MKAIIIGGGIGGICAAIALRRANLDVEIYERAPAIREVGAGLSLWPNAFRALDKLGVGAEIRALGLPSLDGGIHSSRGSLLLRPTNAALAEELKASTKVLHRAELLSALSSRVDPASIRLGMIFNRFEQDENGVTAHFADGTKAYGDLLIGADGIKSAVRAQLAPASQPRYAGYTAWRAISAFDYPPDAVYWGESWGQGARFGLIPVSPGRVYWFAVKNTPEGIPVKPGAIKQQLQRDYRGWHEPIEALINAADETAILHNDIYDIAPLNRWSYGRVTLLGDAAHASTPNLGQGACQAMEDAAALYTKFQENHDAVNALRAYETHRIQRANQILMQSRRIGQIAQWENPIACRLRDAILRLMPLGIQDQQIEAIIDHEV